MTNDPIPPANPDFTDEQWRTLRAEWTAATFAALMRVHGLVGTWA